LRSLIEVLGDAVIAAVIPFAVRTLRRYERWRRSENALMLGVTDTINRLFMQKSVAVAGVRRLGWRSLLGSRSHGAPWCSARWASRATCPSSSLAPGNRHGRPELATGSVHAIRAGARQPVPRRPAARRLAAPHAAGRCLAAVEPEFEELGGIAGGELHRLQLATG